MATETMKVPARGSGQTRSGRRAESGGFVLLYAVMTSTIVLAVGVSIISIALKQLTISTLGRESQYAFYAANTGAECALYWDFHGVLNTIVGGGLDAPAYERLSVFSNPFLRPAGYDAGHREVVAEADMIKVRCAQPEVILSMENSLMRTNGDENPTAEANSFGVDDSWSEGCDDSANPATCWTTFNVFLGRSDAGQLDYSGPCAQVTVTKIRGSSIPCDRDGDGVADERCFIADSSGANLETTVESLGYNNCPRDNPRRVERGLRFTY
jgi:hypothetical protein